MDDIQLYHAKVSVRTKLHLLKNIKQKLSARPECLALFKSTVFGNWLNIKTHEYDNQLLHYLLQHQREVQEPDTNTPFYFDIGQHRLEFGRQDMCLILGFRFGDVSLAHCHKRASGFGKRIMALLTEKQGWKAKIIKAENLVKILNDPFDFAELTADDAVRVCLLIVLEVIFMGKQERNMISNDILVLVDDLYAWNAFPWGEYIWLEFHNKIYHAVSKVRERHLAEIANRGPGYTATYTLCGFVFALKIWVLETFPNATNWWVKDDNVIPRALAWDDGQKFEKNDFDLLFGTSRIVRLMPTVDEENQLWWRASLDYIRKSMPAPLFDDVPASPGMHTPTANTSGARAKLTARKSSHVHRSAQMAGMRQQMAGMQQQINQLRQLVAHLKPDGVIDLPDMGEDMPPDASLVSHMVEMQKQIDGLQNFLERFKSDGLSEENAGSSGTTRVFVIPEILKHAK